MSAPEDLLRGALAAHRSGDIAQARALYERYTRQRPGDASGWQNLAVLAQQAGDFAQADAAVARSLALRPDDPGCLMLAGNIRQDLGDLDGAARNLERAVRLAPGFAQAYNNLGIVQRERGDAQAAESAFRAAVRAKPDYARAWNNLGSTLLHRDHPAEAAECFRKALSLDPGYAHAHLNLGLYLLSAGERGQAEASLLRAIELDPRLPDAHLGLGRLRRETLDLPGAERALRQCLALDPRSVDAWLHLADVRAEMGDRDAALDCYRQAIAVRPTSLRARIGLAMTLPPVYSDAAQIEATRAECEARLAELQAQLPRLVAPLGAEERIAAVQWNNFYLAYQGRDDREIQSAFARLQRSVLEPALPQFYRPIAARPRHSRRLRVGFVSSFFYRSTAGNYFRSWITGLDRQRFETVVFALNSNADELTREVEQSAARFHRQSFTFAGLAQSVRSEDLDVLIYPELGMHPRVFTLASLRLAPLQCAGWGHPVTSGHANVDVFLSSAVMEPPGAEAHYTERLVTLPGIGTCYPRPAPPDPVARSALGLPEEAILYLFPQSLFKVHPDNDAVLVEILAQEPRAVLVMFQSRFEPVTRQFIERLSRRFGERGLPTAGRVKLLPNVGHADYLRVNLACDAMLDSLYWSGGNTTLDALACGLPVVTRPGEFMRGRQSAGMLSLLDLGESVADSDAAYVDLALRLGRDPGYRGRIRAAIAERVDRLFDQESPVRALEDFLLSAVPG